MRVSRYFIPTLKEAPAEAELASHKLMLRSGMIKRLAAGIYTWLPLGLRVMRKVEAIVREEMNRAGAIELLMPVIQPAELWQETGRWGKYGPELLRLKDRHVPIAIDAAGLKLSKQTLAAPLPAAPLPALVAAWRFLDQPLPSGSATPATIAEFWRAAVGACKVARGAGP